MKKYLKKAGVLIMALAFVVSFAFPVNAVYWDMTGTNLLLKGFLELPEISTSTPGTPGTTSWRMYTYNDGFYIIDDTGTPTNLLASTTLDAAYTGGNTITLDASGDVEFDLSVTARNVKIANTFAGVQAVGLEIDAETAFAVTNGILFSTTAGTFVDAIDASDSSITNAINVGGNVIVGALASIDFTEFDVSGTTGAIIINDGGDLGSITIEGTVLDINSLDFVGAAAITSGASTAITINPDGGSAAGEDLIITAHNIALTATGAMDFTPDGAVTLAIDLTDTNYTNAISVGTNAIVGTTGIIDYTNFDVNADGDVECVDLTVSGTANIGTWAQDAIVPASASPQDLTVDAGGTGAVVIAGTSTGTIWLGDDSGGATLVTIGNGTDLLLGEGKLTIDNDQNEDALVITSSATSQSAIEITDAATTTGKMIQANADDLGTAGVMLYLDSDNIAADNYYIGLFDGTGAYNFSVSQYGATVIEGNSTSDVLTLTAGDLQIDDGIFEVNTNEDVSSFVTRNFAGAGGTPALAVNDSNASTTNSALSVTSAGSAGTGLTVTVTGVNNATGIAVVHSGDYPALNITAGAARTTGAMVDMSMTNSVATDGIFIDGAWTGASDKGMVHLHSTGTIASGASMLRLDNDTGTPAADGFAIEIDDGSSDGGEQYAVLIGTTNNEALHVASGISLFAEQVTFSGGVSVGTSEITGTTGLINYTNFDVAADGDVDVVDLDASGNVVVTGNTTVNGNLIGDGATQQYGFVALPVDLSSAPVNIEIADSGKVYFNSEAQQANLPPAAAGLRYTFVVAHASQITIHPDGADQIMHLSLGAGDKATSSTIGDTITLIAVGAGFWYVQSVYPLAADWADGGA